MGIVKAAEWRRRALHSLHRRCGFGPSPSFDCTIFAVLSAKWPSRLWTVSPSAGRSATRRWQSTWWKSSSPALWS